MIYKVSYGNHDEYVPYYLESDRILTQEQFEELALGFMVEAQKRAIEKQKAHGDYVGWREITEALLEVLSQLGPFRLVDDIPEVKLWGPGIIRQLTSSHHPGKLGGGFLKRLRSHQDGS